MQQKKYAPLRPQGEKRARAGRVVESIIASPPSHNDPEGSYTGKPLVPGTVPVQDADDL